MDFGNWQSQRRSTFPDLIKTLAVSVYTFRNGFNVIWADSKSIFSKSEKPIYLVSVICCFQPCLAIIDKVTIFEYAVEVTAVILDLAEIFVAQGEHFISS